MSARKPVQAATGKGLRAFILHPPGERRWGWGCFARLLVVIPAAARSPSPLGCFLPSREPGWVMWGNVGCGRKSSQRGACKVLPCQNSAVNMEPSPLLLTPASKRGAVTGGHTGALQDPNEPKMWKPVVNPLFLGMLRVPPS